MVQKFESQIPSEKPWKKHPENLNGKSVQTLDAQAENMRNYLVLPRNMIPAHTYAAEKMINMRPV